MVFSPTIDEVVRESPCDIAVVKQRGSREIKRVLVPVRGGPHAELAIRFADAIATYHGGTVVVLHLVPPGITMADVYGAMYPFVGLQVVGLLLCIWFPSIALWLPRLAGFLE